MEERILAAIEKLSLEMNARITSIEERMATKEDLELVVEELKAEIQMVYDEVKEFHQDFNMVETQTYKNALDISKIKLAR